MDYSNILSFLGVSVLLTLMPGPDILFVISQSLSQHKHAGIMIAFGLCTGLIGHIAAAAFGISAILYQSATAFTVVKYAGAIYLLWLAWKAFRSKSADFRISKQSSSSYLSLYKKGIIMNLLNPKVSLFFLAFFPQFIDQTSGHVPLQMLELGCVFMIQALAIFSAVSFGSEKLRSLIMRNEKIARNIHFMEGTILAFVGLQIAFSERLK